MCNNMLAVRSCGGQKATATEDNREPPHPPLSSHSADALRPPHSPVLHAGVAPDGLLHVGMALRHMPGPGTLPSLDRTLRDVVAVTSLSAASSATSSCTPAASSDSPAAPPGRWSGAGATNSVLAATLEVVLGAGERHLHPDPGLSLRVTQIQASGGGGGYDWGLLLPNTASQVVPLW